MHDSGEEQHGLVIEAHQRADYLVSLGRYRELREHAFEHLASYPTDGPMFGYLAEAQLRLGNVEDALTSVQDAIRLEPSSAGLVALSARVFLAGERHSDARRAALVAVSMAPSLLQAQVISMRVLIAEISRVKPLVNDPLWREAADMVSTMLRLFPNEAVSHFFDAWHHECHRRNPSALAAVERALAINPTYESAHELRGQLLEAMARRREAGESYVQAGRLNPTNARHGASVTNLVDGTDQRLEFALIVTLLWCAWWALFGRMDTQTLIAIPVMCRATRPIWRRLSTRTSRRELSQEVVEVADARRHVL